LFIEEEREEVSEGRIKSGEEAGKPIMHLPI
jgi:hypothetical protein